MPKLDRIYEAKHLETMQTGANRLGRMLRVNATNIAKDIAKLQQKRFTTPAKYGAQLSRNKQLQKRIEQQFFDLEQNLYGELNGQTADQWALANTKNTLLTQEFTGTVVKKYANLNLDALESFQKRFEGGKNLSQRVHNLTELNKQLYDDYIGSGITQGKSSASIARQLNEINNNPYNVTVFDKDGNPTVLRKISPVLQPNAKGRGVYRSPLKNLFRLTRSETNGAYRLSDITRMGQLDFVVGYEVKLSVQHPLTDVCDFNAGKYPKSFVFTGWHSNCFCYVISILKTKKEFRDGVVKSKNEVTKIPRSAQRYQKTSKKQYWDWEKENYTAKGIPYKKVGGPASGIEPYKISIASKDYRPRKKILKSAAKSVV